MAAVPTLPQLSSATLQQRFNLAYPELIPQQQQQHDAIRTINSLKGTPRVDRGSGAVASTPLTFAAHKSIATAQEEEQEVAAESAAESGEEDNEAVALHDDDHPHHDEDNQMKRNDVHYLLKQLNSFSDIEEIEIVDMKQRKQRPPPRPRPPMASSSLIMMPASPPSPSTQSHKQGQRFASGGHNSSTASSVRLQQFDDYLFESCHYLETNYFAATYRTAMVESSSHEFRPSTNSSSNSFELHEMEPPSVICKAGAPLATTPPPQYQYQYQAESRLTTSGVQTELTVESLAKLSNSASSSSSTRAPPFFRCCYTPIDRWRERRLVARQQKTSAPSKNGQASQSHPV
ncbi:Hypothetical predicted protein [Drosophila guanche]|uniref:Uncharacterized protein n=2 Tax=Drosophila guanche TaxID=7266 RepID=A0A3B0K1P8_DROGU|nr:Hypothetical predicted protein [Drosophila guanche]